MNEEERRARVVVSAAVLSCFSLKEKLLDSRYPLRVCSRPVRVLRTPGRAHMCRCVSAAEKQQEEEEEEEEGSRQSESAFCALLLRLAEFKWS